MNHRILELIKQADIQFDVSSDHYGIDTAVVIPHDLDKFAELLIRECTNMLPEDSIRNADGVHMFYVIREHFGVE